MPNLRRVVKALGRRLRIEIAEYRPAATLTAQRTRIINEIGVSTVLDVGANVGKYGTALRKSGFAGRIVSFEPIPRAFEALGKLCQSDELWDCHNLALSDENGEHEINVANNLASSSFFPMNPRHVVSAPQSKYVGRELVAMQRLDDFAKTLPPFGKTLLKMDVQGYELKVLRGAQRVVSEVSVIEAELSSVALYDGQPLFAEVMEHIEGCGFRLELLYPGFSDPVTGCMLQMDGMFVRDRNN